MADDARATVGEIGERALLRRLRARIPRGAGVVAGVGDDAAAVETGPLTLVTMDCLVEGVHFRREWSPPRLLGRKALSVNLSDIAAMAGAPRYATVTLCLPADVPVGFVDGFYDGLLERAAETGVEVVGGNLAATESAVVVDVTLLGSGDRLLLRSKAAPGDLVVITNTLGAAAAGLRCLSEGARLDEQGDLLDPGRWSEELRGALTHCLRAQLDPAPPLAFGRALAEKELAHAAMDISDGLSGDLYSVCELSDVAAWLDADAVPVDPRAEALAKDGGADGFSLALHGGEDYELVLAVPPAALEEARSLAEVWNVRLSVVGEFTAGEPALSLKFGDTLRTLRPRSHDHFADPKRERRSDPAREA
jgi:thiamine-monophosphate kinase